MIAGVARSSRPPIMANDPHRAIQLPSLRYWVHLVAPGWNVIGAGEPALPGVSVGHNEHGAWGFTIFPIDQEDLYVYETDPEDPSRYRYRGSWEAMRVERETIAVKGQAAVEVELKFTRHGPVSYEDRGRHRAYALGPPGSRRGPRPTWPACGSTRPRAGPSSARRAGTSRPRRKTWSGPTSTATSAGRPWDWRRFARTGTGCCRSRATADTSGTASARARSAAHWPTRLAAGSPRPTRTTFPPGYPFAVGFQWTDPFRFARIEEVLGSGRRFTLIDMMQLQHDELSLPARSLVPLLRGLQPRTARRRQAARAAPGLGLRSRPGLGPGRDLRRLGEELKDGRLGADGPARSPLGAARRLPLDREDHRLADGARRPLRRRPDRRPRCPVLKALDKAVADLREAARPRYEPLAIRPGETQAHPAQAPAERRRERRTCGPGSTWSPLPRGGYGSHRQQHLRRRQPGRPAPRSGSSPTSGDWDRSLGTNTPGSRATRTAPTIATCYRPWAAGEYFPAFFSRAKVESVAEATTVLRPDTGSR